MICSSCNRENGMLMRGKCRNCFPDGHAMCDTWFRLFDEYEAETGKTVLEDYDAFEDWLNRKYDADNRLQAFANAIIKYERETH